MKTESCEQVQSQIAWYLYNELDAEERNVVEEHLESCQACAAELERQKAFLVKLSERRTLEPSAALVAECRHDLMRSIYRADRLRQGSVLARQNPMRVLGEAWRAIWSWWRPIAVASTVAMAFVGGWWIRGAQSGGGRPVNPPSEASIANISAVNLDPSQGRVQISYDEVRPRTENGTVQDPRIQRLLVYAAKSYANPGVRLDTVDILKERAGDREIRNTLLYLIAHDQNDGVRLKALDGLKQYTHDPEVRQALIAVLTKDDNPGMRVQVIDLLTASQDRSLVGILQGVAQKEANNYVRMRCQNALREMNASVETF